MAREHRVNRIRSLAQEALDEVKDRVESVDFGGRVERNPYGVVAVAVGVGYVLGGGLLSPLTGRILGLGLRLGLRLAIAPVIQDQLVALAAGAAGAASGVDHSGEKKSHRNGDHGGKARRK